MRIWAKEMTQIIVDVNGMTNISISFSRVYDALDKSNVYLKVQYAKQVLN